MLVLTRKQNEKIRIGPNITVTVLRMKGKAVRLGIEAPQDVSVIRGELCFDLGDEETGERGAARRGKLGAARRSELGTEETVCWPLPSQEERPLAAAGCGSAKDTSPLRAMLQARHS
jgi:carbon storage regulator